MAKARQIQEALVKDFPEQPQYRADLALTNAQHGRVMLRRGQLPAARATLQKAFEIQDRLAGDFPDETEYRLQAERYRFEFGNVLEEAGQIAQARAAYTQALASVEKLVADRPSAPLHNFIGLIADSLGALLAPSEPEAALRMYEYSLDERQKAWRQAPHLSAYQQDLRSAYLVLGGVLHEQGMHARLAALADRLAADTPEPRIDTYSSACLMALAASSAAKNASVDAKVNALTNGYAERAVKLLQKAVLAGFASNRDEREHMDKDSDLTPLRQRGLPSHSGEARCSLARASAVTRSGSGSPGQGIPRLPGRLPEAAVGRGDPGTKETCRGACSAPGARRRAISPGGRETPR